MAARIWGERRGGEQHLTLGPTALVHEAWLKLASGRGFESRAHVVRTAAMAMRQVLVDHGRQRAADKRGGRAVRTTLSGIAAPGVEVDVVELDQALSRLEALDAEAADVVALRCFGGLTHPEIASALGLSARTVDTRWRHARAWLLVALGVPTPPRS